MSPKPLKFCERCERYFSICDVLLSPQPAIVGFMERHGIPTLFICATSDCAAVALSKSTASKPTLKTSSLPMSQSSCPPERDHTDKVLGDSGARVNLTPNEENRRDRYVYEMLNTTFDGIQPGQWVGAETIRTKLKIRAVNSSASRIRGWASMQGFDIDSKVMDTVHGSPIWAYRLCRSVDSERIKRREKIAV